VFDPERLHMVGAVTARRFAPAPSSENARSLAQHACPTSSPPSSCTPPEATAATTSRRSSLPSPLLSIAQHAPTRRFRSVPRTDGTPFPSLGGAEGIGGRVLCTGDVSEEAMLRLYQATELLCFLRS